ncbi:unnamed protein product [Acanthoscelides obtectus]|uniref:Uncharacterized protein n=1 Tax=Acanthoscelides obtectus TaxID=200917 RepID=A0A9P0P1U3_ACAOB|nr:unnamed protein product [Acanthoscelides obtectus]CAK1631582.1 hypothetical protein AOBTE_LOCUS7018 [Acanthoscelides obtectus]
MFSSDNPSFLVLRPYSWSHSGLHHEGDTVSVTSSEARASVGSVGSVEATGSVDSDNSPSTPASDIGDLPKSIDVGASANSDDSSSNNIEVVKIVVFIIDS